MDQEKPFHLTLQVRNNLLRSMRVSAGLNNQQLCKKLRICPGTYGRLEKLEEPPLVRRVAAVCRIDTCENRAGPRTHYLCKRHVGEQWYKWPIKHKPPEWRKEAIVLAKFYKCRPADLFPPEVVSVAVSRFEKEFSIDDMTASSARKMHSQCVAPQIEIMEHRELLLSAMSSLSDAQRDVVERRFGIGVDVDSIATIASSHGLSTARIEQLENEALRKLREVVPRLLDP